MRRLLAIFVLIGLGASVPAKADVTLTYRPGVRPSTPARMPANPPEMIIAADDAGQARIEMLAPAQPGAERAPSVALITREGVGYFALRGPQAGQDIVGRQEDALALIAPIATGLAAGSAREGVREAMQQRVEIIPVGAERVAGITGNLYRVVIVNGETRSPPIEIVLSTDPRLAPAARELLRLGDSLRPVIVAVAGGEPRIYGAVRALLGLGAPLRIGNEMVLHSISTDDLPDSRFALPGPVLSREQLGQMMGAMMSGTRARAAGEPIPPPPVTTPPNPQ